MNTITSPLSVALQATYSWQLDIDRDIFKLTRTAKPLVDAAIAQIRELYEPDVAEQIIKTAMENKKKFAEEQK